MANPAYDLAVQGIVNFARYGRVLSQRKIARDPLSGVVDGTNTTFYSQYFPILTSGSLLVYTSGSQVSGTADYDTGEITLNTAPSVQPLATYTFTPFAASQVLQFVVDGFTEMENRWTRGWQLVDATGQPANENSANIYVADSSGSDPVCGAILFSESIAQIGFLQACTEYTYIRANLYDAAIGDFEYRESKGGAYINKSKRSTNLDMALKAADAKAKRALEQAQIQFYPNGDQYGAYISNPATAIYQTVYEWQAAAKLDDTIFVPYGVSFRSFG